MAKVLFIDPQQIRASSTLTGQAIGSIFTIPNWPWSGKGLATRPSVASLGHDFH